MMINFRHIIICSFIFCYLFAGWQVKSASAAYMTAFDLIKFCASKDDKEVRLCHGYIAGIIDYHNLTRSLGTAPTINFCVPNYMTISQVVPKVINYLAKAPQNDQFIASSAVALALYKSFPCYNNMPKPTRRKKK